MQEITNTSHDIERRAAGARAHDPHRAHSMNARTHCNAPHGASIGYRQEALASVPGKQAPKRRRPPGLPEAAFAIVERRAACAAYLGTSRLLACRARGSPAMPLPGCTSERCQCPSDRLLRCMDVPGRRQDQVAGCSQVGRGNMAGSVSGSIESDERSEYGTRTPIARKSFNAPSLFSRSPLKTGLESVSRRRASGTGMPRWKAT